MSDPRIRSRVIGVGAGAALGAGFALGAAIAADGGIPFAAKSEHGIAAGYAAIAVVLPVGGYFLGKMADTHWKTFAIVP